MDCRKVVHPEDEVSINVEMFPRRLGERVISATFSADEMTDIEGEATMYVLSKEEYADYEKEKEADDVDGDTKGIMVFFLKTVLSISYHN